MPDTYTKEQIDEAKNWAVKTAESRPVYRGRHWLCEADMLCILLSALDTAERERDENKSKAEQYYKDWYVSKAEFGNITAKLRDRVRTAEARCAELEARLQGAGWISVKERLPEALERVLVFYVNDLGKNRIDVGQYIPPKTILEEDFLDSEINAQFLSTYDKENNCYWVNEGWFEDHWQAEVNYKIHDVVTHWMPLPEPPVGKEGEE